MNKTDSSKMSSPDSFTVLEGSERGHDESVFYIIFYKDNIGLSFIAWGMQMVKSVDRALRIINL